MQTPDDFNLRGLVQLVFSQDKLTQLFNKINSKVSHNEDRISKLENRLRQTECTLTPLVREIPQLHRTNSDVQSHLRLLDTSIQNIRLSLNQIPSKSYQQRFNEGREGLKKCYQYVRKEIGQINEQRLKEINQLSKQIQDNFKKQLSQIRRTVAQKMIESQVQTKIIRQSMSRTQELEFSKKSESFIDQSPTMAHTLQARQPIMKQSNEWKSSYRRLNKAIQQISESVSQNQTKICKMEENYEQLETFVNKQQGRALMPKSSFLSKSKQESTMTNAIRNYCQLNINSKMLELTQKYLLLQEQYKFLFNHIEEFRVKFEHERRQMQKLKVEKTNKYEEMQSIASAQVKSCTQQLLNKIEQRLVTKDFQSIIEKIQSKLSQVNFRLIEKSDKEEVKNALLFLQSRIKEVILLVTHSEKEEKDALFTKSVLKCLSCDKDVERFPASQAGTEPRAPHYLPTKLSSRIGLNTASFLRRKRDYRDISMPTSMIQP